MFLLGTLTDRILSDMQPKSLKMQYLHEGKFLQKRKKPTIPQVICEAEFQFLSAKF
jgi:hypothetical protein